MLRQRSRLERAVDSESADGMVQTALRAELRLAFLMSRFALRPSAWLAEAVLALLQEVTRGERELSEEKRSTYLQLTEQWRHIAHDLGLMEAPLQSGAGWRLSLPAMARRAVG